MFGLESNAKFSIHEISFIIFKVNKMKMTLSQLVDIRLIKKKPYLRYVLPVYVLLKIP